MKVFFETLGCKVNQYESQEMLELFIKHGDVAVKAPETADIIVVNSCTVTAESVRKVRQTVRHLRSLNESAVLILTGCASQAEPQLEAQLPEADIFMGNRSNTDIVNAAVSFLKSHVHENDRIEHTPNEPLLGGGITAFSEHTRAFLKIQDGCDRFCSYCLIPTARGRSRSKPLSDIEKELAALEKSGYEEIVFVGINLSDYGKGTEYSLPDALALAEKHSSIKRVRLGSLEPDHITDTMIEKLRKLKKLCAQFHISVQSGSDSVLKKMNRHYTAAEYEELVKKLRSGFCDATITTDILVGFPTETEEEFKETLAFAERVKFEKAHIFPYSKRDGTPAAKMVQLTNSEKASRAKRLSAVTEKCREEFLKNQVGKTAEVLFEAEHEGYSEGYTANYTPVRVYDDIDRKGKFLTVTIIGADKDWCIGAV